MKFIIDLEIEPYEFIVKYESNQKGMLDCCVPAYDLWFSFKYENIGTQELEKVAFKAESMVKTFFICHGMDFSD